MVTVLPHGAAFTGNKEEELDSDDLDDDDDDGSEQEEGTSSDPEQTGTETLNGLRTYMDQMDEELMSTKIGQSFTVTVNVFFLPCDCSNPNSSSFCFPFTCRTQPPSSVKLISVSSLQNSKKPDLDASPPTQGGSEQTDEEIQPLDLDLNLVTNLLESLSCQAGLAGPASNLLQSLGIDLPANADPS